MVIISHLVTLAQPLLREEQEEDEFSIHRPAMQVKKYVHAFVSGYCPGRHTPGYSGAGLEHHLPSVHIEGRSRKPDSQDQGSLLHLQLLRGCRVQSKMLYAISVTNKLSFIIIEPSTFGIGRDTRWEGCWHDQQAVVRTG